MCDWKVSLPCFSAYISIYGQLSVVTAVNYTTIIVHTFHYFNYSWWIIDDLFQLASKFRSFSTSSCRSVVTDTIPSGNGVVRLYRNGVTSPSYYYGIIQIWYNGHWGNICDDTDYNQYEADVICHQLGYTGALSYPRAGLIRLIIVIIYKL